MATVRTGCECVYMYMCEWGFTYEYTYKLLGL